MKLKSELEETYKGKLEKKILVLKNQHQDEIDSFHKAMEDKEQEFTQLYESKIFELVTENQKVKGQLKRIISKQK